MWGVLPPPLKRVVVATMVVLVAAGERPWFRSSGEVLVSVERGEGWPGLFRVSPFLNSFGEGDGDDDGDEEIVRLLAAALRSPLASLPAVLLYFICTCVVPSRSFPLRKSGKSSSLVGGECTWVEKKKRLFMWLLFAMTTAYMISNKTSLLCDAQMDSTGVRVCKRGLFRYVYAGSDHCARNISLDKRSMNKQRLTLHSNY